MNYVFRAACITIAVFAATAATAQQRGSFDGKYVGLMKCFPAGRYNFNGMTIRGNKFDLYFTFGGSRRGCSVQIKADGMFDNQACDVPMTGKITGDTIEIHFKTQDAVCDVSATREKR